MSATCTSISPIGGNYGCTRSLYKYITMLAKKVNDGICKMAIAATGDSSV